MFRRKMLSMVLLTGMLLGQTVPQANAATFCDQAQFVSDITAPDGSAFAPGASFTKTWRFTNAGSCPWTTSYSIIFTGGDAMGTNLSVKLPVDVPAGQMVDISINLSAPSAPGHYRSLWKFVNASGAQFGIGDSANDAFWVDINVVATEAVIYDFVANAPFAQWKSGAGPLPFPGTSGDSRGFGYPLDRPHLEDDSFDSQPGLLTVPQNKYNGYIQATFPEFQIQQGDKLQTLVNCEFGATGCYVTFRIDYLLPNGAQRTLWSFKEAYDKRFYRANIDLSSLAGQRVRFVFMLLSSGLAGGDRAIWGSPRIIRSGMTQPPAPPPTLTLLPPLTPTQTPIVPPPPTIAPSGCDRATFVTDVNVPDGTTFAPGEAFSKTWRLKNSGPCTWTSAYKLMYYSGEQMSAPTSINIPWNVYPNQTVDLTINMAAPNSPGQYRGFWILANASGTMFGIGASPSNPFWVEINVTGGSPVPLGYDFITNACSAQWKSGAGYLPCPGTDGDSKGFVLIQNTPILEDGSSGAPGLVTFPQNKYNGYIQGYYPTFTVQPGDRFQATVGCASGSSCYVTYRLEYMNPNGYIGTFWTWREQNDRRIHNADVDLTPLAGRSVRFILMILATGYATNDRAVWSSPRIVRPAGVSSTATPPAPPTSTPLPSPTSTPPANDWLTYANETHGFQFKYPPGSQISNQSGNFARIDMPFQPGTNLREKYVNVMVTENVSSCQGLLQSPQPPEAITINGISFLKQTANDGGVGHLRQWVAYSTLRGNTCVTLQFILHSLHPDNSTTPPPVFDFVGESAVFTQIMPTFAWLTPSPAPLTSVQNAVDALNARDFNAGKAYMYESFLFAFWQSQGTAYTPELAIEQLQTNHLGTTPLIPNADKDLLALLGGVNPFSIVGLDPAVSQALFVSGWGLNGNDEAILYATRRTDGTLYWHGVLIAQGGFAPGSIPVSHDAFCADTRVPSLIAQLKAGANQSNGNLFSTLVSPTHGLDVRLWAYAEPVNFSAVSVSNIFSDTAVYNWGGGPSGIPDTGTFKDVIQPKILEVLNSPNMETYCDSLDKVYPLATPWPYPNVRFYNLYKPGTPGIELDFRTWLIGFEYINNQPYLHSLVTIVWEP